MEISRNRLELLKELEKLQDRHRLLKYRLAIFDSDGTLADTLPWMRSIFNELAHEHGFRKVEAHEYEQFHDLHGTALLRALGLPLWKLPQVVNSMRGRMSAYTGKLALFPGISDVLRRLDAAGVCVAVVSSNSQDNVERILGPENAALITRFACGVSMFGKAAKLRNLIRQLKIPPEHAIYIGDEVRDAEAAQKAGLAFGAVTWGHHREELLRQQNPALIFSRVEDIAKKVLK